MSGFSRVQGADMQQCIYCGKHIRRNLKQCPHCREAQTEKRATEASAPKMQTRGHFRTGLLLMLMSAMVHYFVGGYNPMLVLPNDITSPVLTYLVPLMFVGGLLMSLYGFFLRVRA